MFYHVCPFSCMSYCTFGALVSYLTFYEMYLNFLYHLVNMQHWLKLITKSGCFNSYKIINSWFCCCINWHFHIFNSLFFKFDNRKSLLRSLVINHPPEVQLVHPVDLILQHQVIPPRLYLMQLPSYRRKQVTHSSCSELSAQKLFKSILIYPWPGIKFNGIATYKDSRPL